uniref:Uncharacterized protein n=1 Tax=Ochrobactrum phage ORM_20 TaxID=2985243 RepID=A0A9N6WSN9_9VIRU|nr:hypothetical protein ORM20_00160 [Ochrobactrum phage ORM_20]
MPKFIYDDKDEALREKQNLIRLMPKCESGSPEFSVFTENLGDRFVNVVFVRLGMANRCAENFAADRIMILDDTISHNSERVKKNVRRASIIVRALKFVIRNHQKHKFAFKMNYGAGIINRMPWDIQSELSKLQRQIRIQNRFIAAVRKYENARNG